MRKDGEGDCMEKIVKWSIFSSFSSQSSLLLTLHSLPISKVMFLLLFPCASTSLYFHTTFPYFSLFSLPPIQLMSCSGQPPRQPPVSAWSNKISGS